jgi:hypothetical protein
MEDFHKKPPVDKDGGPYIPSLVRRLMPNASEQELIEATENLRRFVCVAEKIYLEMKRNGTLPEGLKRLEGRGDVGTS